MKISVVLKISVFILLSSIYWSCDKTPKKRNIENFYFPIEDLKEGKVYEYRSITDSIAPFYWYFNTSEVNNQTFLTSEYFDHNFVIRQLTNNVIVNNGVRLKDFFLYETDTLTGKQIQNRVKVNESSVFPFLVTDSTGLFLYDVSWESHYPPKQKYQLIKNRHFMGDDSYTFQGKTVDCVRFFTKELLAIEEEGFQELTYNSVELFAKNIGLVYFRKEMDNNIVQEYELAAIYEMKELEKRFREQRAENRE